MSNETILIPNVNAARLDKQRKHLIEICAAYQISLTPDENEALEGVIEMLDTWSDRKQKNGTTCIYELVDSTNPNRYYPISVFLTFEEAWVEVCRVCDKGIILTTQDNGKRDNMSIIERVIGLPNEVTEVAVTGRVLNKEGKWAIYYMSVLNDNFRKELNSHAKP